VFLKVFSVPRYANRMERREHLQATLELLILTSEHWTAISPLHADTSDVLVDLGTRGGNASFALGISEGGEVVGTAEAPLDARDVANVDRIEFLKRPACIACSS
jgi:hypothetical protein